MVRLGQKLSGNLGLSYSGTFLIRTFAVRTFQMTPKLQFGIAFLDVREYVGLSRLPKPKFGKFLTGLEVSSV